MIDRSPIFAAVGGLVPGIWNIPGTVERMDAVLDLVPDPAQSVTCLTERMVLEIVEHEAIVLEAYKDSVGVWTWSVGITSASGHSVERYKDTPQSLQYCLAVYVWLLRTKYLPAVLDAFADCPLAEHELAAALSFHWNTGAIGQASWVQSWKEGKRNKAHAEFMNWSKPAAIIPRRKAERALFFEQKWVGDGTVLVWPVRKPSYTPDWRNPQMLDIRAALKEAMK